MNQHVRLLRSAMFALAATAGCFSATVSAQTPADWQNGAYAYSAQGTPLRTVLQDFASSHGVNLRLGDVPDSVVDGRLRSDSGVAFLDRLALQYRFQWFVYNGSLFVSPQSAETSKRISVSADAAPDLKQALRDVGLLEDKFGYGELPDDGVVIVTGPPEYVALVADFSAKDKDKKQNKEMMAFPLKYASVADREIKYREKTLLVPGVATILNELLGKKSTRSSQGIVPGGEGSSREALNKSFQEQSDNILSGLIQGQDSRMRGAGGDDEGEMNPLVSADVRNNALLVRDDPKRREQYQALISQIDVPQKLVEIDAMIIDVDRHAFSKFSSNLSGTFGNITAGSSMLQGAGTLFVTDYSRFFAQIQAMEGEGNASIVANPSILTLENQPAVIDMSDTAFITATGERVATIEPVTAGTSLQVVPRAIGNGPTSTVQLVVDVEDGKVQVNDDGVATGAKRATVSTQALVQQNGSLVMGGFHSRETGDTDHRIPLLGDIPYLGKFFSYTSHETSQRERLFIITPHLVGDQVDPTRYIDEQDRQQLSSAMNEVQLRQRYSSMKGDIENAMRDLAEDKVPTGFQAGGEGVGIGQLCNVGPGLSSDSSHSQWYSNSSVQISVGLIRNISGKPQRFDESSCRDDDVLAVAAWPGGNLAPGQSAEVYIAYRTRGEGRRSRQSLLSSASSLPVNSSRSRSYLLPPRPVLH